MTQESAAALEQRANALRGRIASTAKDLSENLRPQNLKEEAISTLRLRELAPQHLLGVAGREHPIATILCGLAAGYFLQAAARRWRAPIIDHEVIDAQLETREEGPATHIANAAREVIDQGVGKARERVLEVGDTLAEQATAQLTSALTRASSLLERTVEHAMEKAGAPEEIRDLATGILKLLVSASLTSGARIQPSAR